MSQAIKIASIIYASSILLSRVIGLVRESIIGRILGESTQADVYWMAFILPDFLNYLLAGGAISLVLIPLLQKSKTQDGSTGMWLCLMRVATPLSILVSIFTGILWLCVDPLSAWIAPGFSTQQLEELSHLTRIILPAQIFHVTGALFSAALQAEDKHFAPAIAPILYTIGIIAGGVLLGSQWGAEGFAWGVLFGSIIGPFMTPLCVLIRMKAKLTPCWTITHPDVTTYLWRIFPVMIGFSIVVGDEMIVKRFASDLGVGMVSQLHYARILMKVPMGVFGLALGMATFPTLSRLCVQNRHQEAYHTLYQAAESLLILVGLAQVFLICSSTECAALIWGRTQMSDQGLLAIGLYCGCLSLGLWAWSLQGLAARGFYAQGKTWIPTLIGSTTMVCVYPIYMYCSQWKGIGLAMASSIAISFYVTLLWYAVCRSLQGKFTQLIWSMFKILVAVLVSIFCTEYICICFDITRTSLMTYLFESSSFASSQHISSEWHAWSGWDVVITHLLIKSLIACGLFIVCISQLKIPMYDILIIKIKQKILSRF